jgi:hypothetical protein
MKRELKFPAHPSNATHGHHPKRPSVLQSVRPRSQLLVLTRTWHVDNLQVCSSRRGCQWQLRRQVLHGFESDTKLLPLYHVGRPLCSARYPGRDAMSWWQPTTHQRPRRKTTHPPPAPTRPVEANEPRYIVDRILTKEPRKVPGSRHEQWFYKVR